MAVMYSKLGGCLGVTTKLGPLARTDLWAGVKGLLERLMTHLGLGSSLEEPWGGLLGGGGGVVFLGGGIRLLGRLGCPVTRGLLIALPKWPGRITNLTCLGGARGLRWAASFAVWKERSSLGGIASFPCGKENSCLGRAVTFTWGKVRISWERIATFPRRKVRNWQSKKTAWCLTV